MLSTNGHVVIKDTSPPNFKIALFDERDLLGELGQIMAIKESDLAERKEERKSSECV